MAAKKNKPMARWPLLLIAAPAAVAIWSGWVGLGGMSGFGIVHPLPGIWDSFKINTAVTLPIGVESYAAYALGAWLRKGLPSRARKFAKRSGITSLVVGTLGQVAYHLLAAAHQTVAPWEITMLVSALPVIVLGMAAALMHLAHDEDAEPAQDEPQQPAQPQADFIPAVAPVAFTTPQEAAEARKNAALNIVESRPELLEPGQAAELGRVLGMSERTGQRLAKQLRSVRGAEWQPLAPDNA